MKQVDHENNKQGCRSGVNFAYTTDLTTTRERQFVIARLRFGPLYLNSTQWALPTGRNHALKKPMEESPRPSVFAQNNFKETLAATVPHMFLEKIQMADDNIIRKSTQMTEQELLEKPQIATDTFLENTQMTENALPEQTQKAAVMFPETTEMTQHRIPETTQTADIFLEKIQMADDNIFRATDTFLENSQVAENILPENTQMMAHLFPERRRLHFVASKLGVY
ncbi:hypothetical protein EDC01DRAFT_634110 [Geopyxis carbonaria]|nr:hypothetical protein EDC01DRAFT_634110 [Geopyxis carbonaria]